MPNSFEMAVNAGHLELMHLTIVDHHPHGSFTKFV
jgi:hypothetical protein